MSLNKYVIFSALVGGYDNINQPKFIDNEFDYILFSNDIENKNIGVWQIRKINYNIQDTTRICRYVKTHPDELLPEYDFSIWIDASIQINDNFIYKQAISLFNNGVQFASMYHPARDCIYDEAFAVMSMMIEHESIIVKWCHKIKKEGYPVHLGLFETGITFRAHTTNIAQFNALWWNCIEKYSRRDQLSCNYCLWKLKIPFFYFAGEGRNVRNMSKSFSLLTHNNVYHNNCSISSSEAWLMRYVWKKKDSADCIRNLYYHIYGLPNPLFWCYIMGQMYRVKYWLINISK